MPGFLVENLLIDLVQKESSKQSQRIKHGKLLKIIMHKLNLNSHREKISETTRTPILFTLSAYKKTCSCYLKFDARIKVKYN